MVSSQISGLTDSFKPKLIQHQFLFPRNSVDAVAVDCVELDFSDVFGALPFNEVESANLDLEGERKLVFDDPEIIRNRSHSLVGPSSFVSKSFGLTELTIHESEDSGDQIGFISEDDIGEILEPSNDNHKVEGALEGVIMNPTKAQGVGLDDFEILKVVGAGAFAKVYQVRKKGTLEIYAMKVMRKDKIMEKNHAGYMKAERDILTKVEHPYIVQLRYSFQTKYRLYLVLDFVNGGHLFFQLYHQGLFREELARVYAAEIVSAVSHLHDNGVMHRDLKPENILLDIDGHAMLTDFGLAKQFDANTRNNSMCGTVEYMSPEIVLGKGHDKAADWWSVGILLFEMLTGKPPFTGNRDKVQQKIVKDKIKLPSFLSSEAHSLLKGLLQKNASKRLGNGLMGGEDIKRHKWFKPINWKKLESRGIEPSFRPQIAGKHCVANFEKHWTDMPIADSPVGSPKGGGNAFMGFSYVRPPASFLSR